MQRGTDYHSQRAAGRAAPLGPGSGARRACAGCLARRAAGARRARAVTRFRLSPSYPEVAATMPEARSALREVLPKRGTGPGPHPLRVN